MFFVCVCVEKTGQVKNCLGECNLKVTCPDGECSKILVSNPECDFWNFKSLLKIIDIVPSLVITRNTPQGDVTFKPKKELISLLSQARTLFENNQRTIKIKFRLYTKRYRVPHLEMKKNLLFRY